MDTPAVLRAGPDDVDSLVTRLEQHGPASAKFRFGLLLLRNGVNKYRYEILYSGQSEDIIVLLITIVSASFRVVSAFVADVPSSADRLAALLRCAEVRSAVWRYTWRADCWPERLLPVLNAAAEELHFSVEIGSTQVSFARPAGLAPVEPFAREGVDVRPLQLSEHLPTVKRCWPYTDGVPNPDAFLGDGIAAGLSAGAFITEPPSPTSSDVTDNPEESLPADGLACWILVNHDGGIGFLHTLTSQRRRGLAGAVLSRLTRDCEAAGYPAAFHTNHPAVRRLAERLNYQELFPVFWAMVTPTADQRHETHKE